MDNPFTDFQAVPLKKMENISHQTNANEQTLEQTQTNQSVNNGEKKPEQSFEFQYKDIAKNGYKGYESKFDIKRPDETPSTEFFPSNNFLNNDKTQLENMTINYKNKPYYKDIFNFSPEQSFDSKAQKYKNGDKNFNQQTPKSNLSYFMQQVDQDDDILNQDAIFLLAEEDNNISSFRELIEREKAKLQQDLEFFQNEFNNIIETAKMKLYEAVDSHYKNYVSNYRDFKQEVIEFKNVKLEIMSAVSSSNQLYHQEYQNVSNGQLLKELDDLKQKNKLAKVLQNIQYKQKEFQFRIQNITKQIMHQSYNGNKIYNQEGFNQYLYELKTFLHNSLQMKMTNVSDIIYDVQTPVIDEQQATPIKENNLYHQNQDYNQYQQTQNHFIDQKNHFIDQKMFSQPLELNNQQNQQYEGKITFDGKNLLLALDQPSNGQLQLNQNLKIQCMHKENLLCICAISADLIATGSKDGIIELWSISQNRRQGVLRGHQGSICSLSVFPTETSTLLLSGSDHGDSSIIVWDTQSMKQISQLKGHSAAVVSLVAIGDNQTLLSGAYDREIRIWNVKTSEMIQKMTGHHGSISSMVLSKDGTRFASASLDEEINIWKIYYEENYQKQQVLKRCSLERTILNNGFACSMATISAAPHILIVGSKDGRIYLWNMLNGELDQTINVNHGPVVELLCVESESHLWIISAGTKDNSVVISEAIEGGTQVIDLLGDIKIEFGCGIGPKLQMIGSGTDINLIVINQEDREKNFALWNLKPY